VDRFKQRCLEYTPDGTVPKADLYDIYLRYCEEEGIPAETQNKLTRTLKQDSQISDGRANVDGRRQRCYMGIAVNEDRVPQQRSEAEGEGEGDTTGTGLGDYD
jgi:phage/plasmid-associated DNA primase